MVNKQWQQTGIKLLPSAVLMVIGGIIANHYGKLPEAHTAKTRYLSLVGNMIFVYGAVIFLHIFTRIIRRYISGRRLGAARAASVQFILRLIGYVTIFLATLNFLNVPVGKLLLGGAVIGVILGVAAQQALANFFASIVLIMSRPFSVGQEIMIISGALGGKYEGTIKDIGLTHTTLKEDDGKLVLLPNAALLSGATIRTPKVQPPPSAQANKTK